MKVVSEEILKKAYEFGLSLRPEYIAESTEGHWPTLTPGNNRRMELAFLEGLLGYGWDRESIERSV